MAVSSLTFMPKESTPRRRLSFPKLNWLKIIISSITLTAFDKSDGKHISVVLAYHRQLVDKKKWPNVTSLPSTENYRSNQKLTSKIINVANSTVSTNMNTSADKILNVVASIRTKATQKIICLFYFRNNQNEKLLDFSKLANFFAMLKSLAFLFCF